MLRTIHAAEQRPVTVLGISLGATYTLLAAEREPDAVGPIVAFSVDTDARESDAAVAQFLNAQAALRADRRLSARVARLGSPPYTQTASFHLRARLIADLGGVVSLPMPTPVAVHPSFEVDRRGISRAA
jgi:pimeloyl-ACP methyl ester carboxylesterase